MRTKFILLSVFFMALAVALYFLVWPKAWWLVLVPLPFILLGIYDMSQTRHAIMRNFPLVGRGRYYMEMLRPGVQQYFIESDVEGRPINRMFRSVVYQRAKDVLDTTPFGTQMNLYDAGYEWANHSIAALDAHQLNPDPRIKIGGPECLQPYSCSVFNVSAMSFGSLSKTAIMALNGGAKIGGFAHNTGEGGISPYHKKFGGDLIYQIGTRLFWKPLGRWEFFTRRV